MRLVVVETGEVEGWAAPGSEVLVGDQVTTADFDGYFLIDRVRFGTYQVSNGGRVKTATITRDQPVAVVNLRVGSHQ